MRKMHVHAAKRTRLLLFTGIITPPCWPKLKLFFPSGHLQDSEVLFTYRTIKNGFPLLTRLYMSPSTRGLLR